MEIDVEEQIAIVKRQIISRTYPLIQHLQYIQGWICPEADNDEKIPACMEVETKSSATTGLLKPTSSKPTLTIVK
jgi:hypothetical protein